MEVAAVPAKTEDRWEQHRVVNGQGGKLDHSVGHYSLRDFQMQKGLHLVTLITIKWKELKINLHLVFQIHQKFTS